MCIFCRSNSCVSSCKTQNQTHLRYCQEFMLEPRVSSDECPTDDNNSDNNNNTHNLNNNPPIIRIKVIPASFGLDGFGEAVWETTESMIMIKKKLGDKNTQNGQTNESCPAVITTLVVAAPDLFTDPILLDGISPQAEFESDRFRIFCSNLKQKKLALISKNDGAVLNDDIHIASFHPFWRLSDSSESSASARKQFPYPCVAISMRASE